MFGRADLVCSCNWYQALLKELIAVITIKNPSAMLLMGAVIPAIQDTKVMVHELVARNVILQKKVLVQQG